MPKGTAIRMSYEGKDKLERLRKRGESFENIIMRIIKENKRWNKKL